MFLLLAECGRAIVVAVTAPVPVQSGRAERADHRIRIDRVAELLRDGRNGRCDRILDTLSILQGSERGHTVAVATAVSQCGTLVGQAAGGGVGGTRTAQRIPCRFRADANVLRIESIESVAAHVPRIPIQAAVRRNGR